MYVLSMLYFLVNFQYGGPNARGFSVNEQKHYLLICLILLFIYFLILYVFIYLIFLNLFIC